MLNIIIDVGDFSRLQSAMLLLARDTTPLMQKIGEYMEDQVENAFATETSPYGMPWAPLSDVTIAKRENPTNPILFDTGALANSFRYSAGKKSVSIGSDMIYAATQQFGARRGQYGTMRNGIPIPWGDIPARPILPIRRGRMDLPLHQVNDLRKIVYEYIRTSLTRRRR